MEEAVGSEISSQAEGHSTTASPMPVGDDLSDFELAEQRFKESWNFDSTDATPEARTSTPESASGRPKRRIRASLEGRTSTPIKLSRTPAKKPSPASRRPARRSLTMPEEVIMERPSAWMDLLVMLLSAIIATVVSWVIFVGVDMFWEG